MIGTLPRGVGSVLDAPDLAPFWQAADDTGAVVHIHPPSTPATYASTTTVSPMPSAASPTR